MQPIWTFSIYCWFQDICVWFVEVSNKLLQRVGGGDGQAFLNDLYIFDAEGCAWSQGHVAGSSPSSRHRHTATVVGTKLFVFGGGDDRHCS